MDRIAGSVGTPECAAPPFEDEFATNYFFSYEFRTANDQDDLLDQLKMDNGITSTTPLNNWIFDFGAGLSNMGKIHSSSYTFLTYGDELRFGASAEDEIRYGCLPGECLWRWIDFQVSTYFRFLPAYDPNPSIANMDPNDIQKRRSTTDALAVVQELADAIIDKLMTNMTLPNGTIVTETTPVLREITMLALNGDTSGVCGDDGCTCINGYEMDENDKCIPPADTTDTCSSDPDICSENASCKTYSTGGSQCICNTGFEGDGIDCTDTDECGNDICPAHSICSNTEGSFECTCDGGYGKIGRFCVDLNECRNSTCDEENQSCKNTDGSYECQCQTGYSMIDGDCELAEGMIAQCR